MEGKKRQRVDATAAAHLCIIQQKTKMGSRNTIWATLMAVKLPLKVSMPSKLTGSCNSPAELPNRRDQCLRRLADN